MDFEHNFPRDISFVPFTSHSYFPTNSDTQNHEISTKQRNIILGGFESSIGGFFEFIVDDTNTIKYKSFEIDYNKVSANAKCTGLYTAEFAHSYLIENNKLLVVFCGVSCYNVYDMENDKWLLPRHGKTLMENISRNSTFESGIRSVMINDEMILISVGSDFLFYFIGYDNIIDPILIHHYKLKTNNIEFICHGMCVIKCVKHESGIGTGIAKQNAYVTYKLKIVLFGGKNNPILSSFLLLDIFMSYVVKEKTYQLVKVSINENLIDKKEIKVKNSSYNLLGEEWKYFGYQCVYNDKNEPIIIVIGGSHKIKRDIYLFNCLTYEISCKEQVW